MTQRSPLSRVTKDTGNSADEQELKDQDRRTVSDGAAQAAVGRRGSADTRDEFRRSQPRLSLSLNPRVRVAGGASVDVYLRRPPCIDWLTGLQFGLQLGSRLTPQRLINPLGRIGHDLREHVRVTAGHADL